MLWTLVLTNPKCVETDFSSPPWNNASLVTPRHGVRWIWNDVALRKHRQETQSIILECQVEDTIKGQPLPLHERYAALLRQQGADSRQRKQDLLDIVRVACGMKVMVTQSVKMDLDITNGARGTIVNIWLNPDEPPISTVQPLIQLKYMPVCILVKLDHTQATQLKELEKSVIPVEPTCKPYRITCQTAEGSIVTCTVHRCQFPMTAAYAFTDYRSQGQTIPAVIVDITTPPTGKRCQPP